MELINSDTYKIKYNVCQQTIATLQSSIQMEETKKTSLEIELKNLEQVHELLTKLKQFKMDSKKEFILKTINTALKDIFQEEIRIDIEASSNLENGKMNMKYDIILFQNNIEIARNEKLISSNGGGVLSVISILFKMLVGFIYSENKFYMFDESLSQVSADYRPRLSKFLKEFCTVHGFTIILVSHTEELDAHADLIYALSGSFDKEEIPVLNIQETTGHYPENDYIYTKIKNFQSIVDLEFRFKGFTIIRGSNNIGKSATLRAINSVIFNDFDKNMQRITSARSIETSIEFGFYHQSEEGVVDETKKIRVSYKSQKVNYEFDGMTFAGKNLAFDKVQEKIESIGFRYINLKETYKNFKGNLKDQTERLSLTTQHDGLFLIGAKNTDSSKIFDFLFDSYQVANAISRVKIDINDRINQFNDCLLKIQESSASLKIELLKEQYFSYKYYIALINNQNIISSRYSLMVQKEQYLISIKSYLENIIYIYRTEEYIRSIKDRINSINNSPIQSIIRKLDDIIKYSKSILIFNVSKDNLIKLGQLNKSIENKQAMITRIDSIINYGRYLLFIDSYLLLKERYNTCLLADNKIFDKINTIQKIIEVLKNVLVYKQSHSFLIQSLQFIEATTAKILGYQTNLTNLQSSINNLEQEFNLQKCPSCNGIGYIHNH